MIIPENKKQSQILKTNAAVAYIEKTSLGCTQAEKQQVNEDKTKVRLTQASKPSDS